MECKYCNKKIENEFIQFIHRDSKQIAWTEGLTAKEIEVIKDGGIFCSKKCLKSYLD